MVDRFVRSKRSTEHLRHDVAMFTDVTFRGRHRRVRPFDEQIAAVRDDVPGSFNATPRGSAWIGGASTHRRPSLVMLVAPAASNWSALASFDRAFRRLRRPLALANPRIAVIDPSPVVHRAPAASVRRFLASAYRALTTRGFGRTRRGPYDLRAPGRRSRRSFARRRDERR